MHVASLIIFCHLKKVLRRFCGALLYQISWRAARKADKHGEYGGQQLNSVLTVQLMGFFCCSNEIFFFFAGMWGEICPETGTRAHAPIHRQYMAHRKRERETKKRLVNIHTHPFAWHWVQHLHFYYLRTEQSQT